MSLSELADSLDYSPDELQRIENRLDLFQKLMFKHHVQTTEELLELQENLKKDIKNIDELANKIVKKEANLLQIETELRDTAIKLYNERKKAIPELEKLIIKLISRLGMQDGKFIIQLEKLDEPTIFGFDKLELKFSANKGIEPEALERVASGGEMSRLMLALKSIIASQNYLPTLIFDEIDMGVSGNIAAQMADLLSDMSMHHQVIVITHLPQIAAKANYHIQVEKKSDRDITHSEFKYLTDDERIISIASMLSNDNILDTAIDTARQLLKQV
jgi:DNA repair protein RecN (Recombination protein N)